MLRIANLRCNLHREIRIVLTGKQLFCKFIKYFSQLTGMVLTHSKYDGLSDFISDGISERIIQKRLAENAVGFI